MMPAADAETLSERPTGPDPTPHTELCARVRAVLAQRMSLPAGQVRISECDGAIILHGEVARFYDRQLAVACAQHVTGVRAVIDRIRVAKASPPLALGKPESR